MDQARWVVVVIVIFCMMGALTLLHRWSRQEAPGPVTAPALIVATPAPPPGPERPKPETAVPATDPHLREDAEFSFGELPTHCQGTDDTSAVANSHQSLERFGAGQ